MKRCMTIIFLFVILLQSVSSLYICASFYLNRDYISENICINRFDKIPVCKGQCYLAKEINEHEKQEKKFPDLKQKEIQLFCQENTIFNTSMIFETLSAKTQLPSEDMYSSNFYSSVFHPPKFC